MYAQVSTRMAKLWGGYEDKSTTKWGLGAGLGVVNPIFNDNFYYTIGLNVTRYFTGENIIFNHGGVSFDSGFTDDSSFIVEFDLRIGYAF